MRISLRWGAGLLATLISGLAWAHSESPPNTLSSSLGVSVYPSKGQSPTVQEQDESQCFAWAKSQTGYNPMTQPAEQPAPPAFGPGHRIMEKEAAEKEHKQAEAISQEHGAFNKAFSSCMVGKGYSAK